MTNRTLFSSAMLGLLLLAGSCKNTEADKNRNPVLDKTENTLNIRIEAEPTGLNSLIAPQGYSRYVSGQLFMNLGIPNPATASIEPLMVTEIPTPTQVADGPYKGDYAFAFEIVPEAVWDNGTPVTGHDVLFTYKIIGNPKIPLTEWRSFTDIIHNIEVDPANPKKFTCYFRSYYILALETLCQTPVYPEYKFDPNGLMKPFALVDLLDPKKAEALAKTNPNIDAFAAFFTDPSFANQPDKIGGCGPYRVETIKPGEGVILVKKENWWGDRLASKNKWLNIGPTKLVFRVVPDENAVETGLKNGEYDVVATLAPQRYIAMKSNPLIASGYDFETPVQTQFNYWLMNFKNPVLADGQVRKALAHLPDYQTIVNVIQQGMAERTIGPINVIKPYYNKSITPYPFDLNKAKEILAQDGWTDTDNNGVADKMINGKKTELNLKLLTSGKFEINKQIAMLIVENAQKVGVHIEPVWKDLSEITDDLKKGNYETAMLGAGQFPGLDDLTQLYHSKNAVPGGSNRGGYASQEADQLMDEIRVTADPEKRKALYFKIQERLHEDLPMIFLTNARQRMLFSKRFKHFTSLDRPGFLPQYFTLEKK